MNTYQAFLNSSTDIFWFAESLFEDEWEDFNFELTPHHILSEVTWLKNKQTLATILSRISQFILD